MSSLRQNQQQASATSAASTSESSSTAITIPPVIGGNVATPASAATAITKAKTDYVQVDALVLLKVLKHCQENSGGADLAQGILTGMVTNQDNCKRIEITNCFGLPNINNLKSGDYDDVCQMLITDNLKTFRHLNIDHLIVGWYQSSLFGTFVNKNFIEDQYMYQTSIDESVVLIYDPFKSQHGSLFLKAYRLTPAMMEMQKRKEFTPDVIKEFKLNHDNFMEELPVVIKNSHLVNSVLCEMQDMKPAPKKYSFLDLSTNNVLEKNVRSLIENVDELAGETTKLLNYNKQLQKQNHLKQQYLQKREAENSARRTRGEAPLPEEDINKIFKPMMPVSRLENLLVSQQINNYCEQINDFASLSFSNLFLTEALQQK